MQRDRFLRSTLWAAALFNLGGATLFGWPSLALAQFVGLPQQVPILYRAFMVLFILLFAGAYAWLAAQPLINRPFVAFGAIGKASAFALIFVLWLAGAASLMSVAMFSGDLMLAAAFVFDLSRSGQSNRRV